MYSPSLCTELALPAGELIRLVQQLVSQLENFTRGNLPLSGGHALKASLNYR